MEFKLIPDRLKNVRTGLGLNKAEAARLLDLSKMGYGRYESGERSPSPQMISYMAQRFNTSVEYLTGRSDSAVADQILISRTEESELFDLVERLKTERTDMIRRLEAYYDALIKAERRPQ